MTMDERVVARRAELTQQLAAVPPDDHLPATATREDLARNQQQRREVERKLAVLDAAVASVTTFGSSDEDERWLAHLKVWRDVLCAERMEIKSPIRDPREKGRERNLALSIKTIDRGLRVFDDTSYELTNTRLGELMRSSGYDFVQPPDPSANFVGKMPWHGSMPEVEQRIATLAEQRANAHAALETALLSDEEREQRDAESKRLREAFNAMNVKHGPDGTCLVAYRNGEVLPLGEMTPLQRRAFEVADAAFRAAHR